MKKVLLYIMLALPAVGVTTSCAVDALDTAPSTSMSGDGLFSSAKAALVPLNGIYRSMYTSGWSTTANTHQCFGISAYTVMADVMGEDMIMGDQGSGWFWYDCLYNVKSRFTSSAWRSYDVWFAYYTWISNANYIIAAEETMQGTVAEKNYVIGQAYAIRAYSYYYLAQLFSRTYIGHENNPCVPIYTEPTSPKTEGQPRSTVQQVYDQLYGDINKAIEILKDAGTQTHKSHIDYHVANGIKARICLTMNKWTEAAAAAKIAREGYAIGATADITEGMNSLAPKNVMWGAEIIADQSGKYAGLFTHMDTTTPSSLYANTAPKIINKLLYAKMGINDVRRAWWDPTTGTLAKFTYVQRKFSFSDAKEWMGDYIWMRAEEMLLTEAEAECRLGNDAKAQTLLKELMAKRDIQYTVTKTGTSMGALTTTETGSLLEEVIIQRRIELWGEVGRIYDIRRLKQGFTRTTAMGWPTSALLAGNNTQNPESYAWVLTIPQSEFDGNTNMDLTNDQNPINDGI